MTVYFNGKYINHSIRIISQSNWREFVDYFRSLRIGTYGAMAHFSERSESTGRSEKISQSFFKIVSVTMPRTTLFGTSYGSIVIEYPNGQRTELVAAPNPMGGYAFTPTQAFIQQVEENRFRGEELGYYSTLGFYNVTDMARFPEDVESCKKAKSRYRNAILEQQRLQAQAAQQQRAWEKAREMQSKRAAAMAEDIFRGI